MGSPARPSLLYTKPYKSVPDQIKLLTQRGMVITDLPLAQACLERIGYYRLSGYWYPFRKSHQSTDLSGNSNKRPKKVQLVVEDDFRPGTTFQQVMALYVFDKRLRLIFLDAIERIEVALRVDLALFLGKRQPYAHRDPKEFDPRFGIDVDQSGQTQHEIWLQRLDQLFDRSKEEFAKHFREKYPREPVPIWVAIELWDFGILSILLSGLKTADRNALSHKYLLPRPKLLPSFARNINNIRNICAHHSRLWNRSPADRISRFVKGDIPDLDHLVAHESSFSRIYATAAVMQYLLRFINPSTMWADRLKNLFAAFPTGNGVDPFQAGFPHGWESLPLWKSPQRQFTEREIASRAYSLWEKRGAPFGDPESDWFKAERQLLESL